MSDLDQGNYAYPYLHTVPTNRVAFMAGVKDPNAQTLETRAPEVWRGFGVWPVSDVWSLGVTVRSCPETIFTLYDKSWILILKAGPLVNV